MRPYFIGAPLLQDIGGGRFTLMENFGFGSGLLNQIVVAPAGMTTDLASIPPYLGFLIPKLGDWDWAALIHDAAYQGVLEDVSGNVLRVDKATADKLFREGLEAKKVRWTRRQLMYLAVHWFGRGKFPEKANV